MQERMIKAVFNYDTVEEVLEKGVKEAQKVAGETLSRVRRGVMDPRELIISKRLSRDLKDYSARQPHIVAAMLGGMEEMSRYILVNTKCSNPFMRVMPKSMIDDEHQTYDRRKYSAMTRRAAWNLLRTFIPDEDEVGWRKTRTNKLNVYF
jgi:DNA polymerase elongation subunit (family B)